MNLANTAITQDGLFDFGLNIVQESKDKPLPPPIEWIENNFIDPISTNLIKLEPHQKRIIRRALQVDQDGYSKYNLVIWSEPKKSGKTAVAGAIGAYIACNVESPNEVSCVANDKEQSAGRIYAAMQPTLKKLGWNTPVSLKGERRDPISYGPNGSFTKAITINYEKEAGGNQGLSLWSELWAYKGERLNRLWDEMVPPPTRKFSMRWVESYAGFINENILFQNMYLRIFKDFNEQELQPGVVKVWKDLPVYELGGTLVYWSHFHRMPWQTKLYYDNQREDARPATYRRLHENWWVESGENFITDDMWKNSLRKDPEFGQAYYALDGSKNGDCTVLVGCRKVGNYVHTVDVRIWEPEPGEEVPYGDIEDEIVRLHKEGMLKAPLFYDDYQMAYLAQRLRLRGVRCKEFGQRTPRIKSDTLLFKLYNEGKMINLPHDKLRKHVLAATAIEQKRTKSVRIQKPDDEETEIRIVKPTESASGAEASLRKVDAAVAQSMAAYIAWSQSSGGGWGLSGV